MCVCKRQIVVVVLIFSPPGTPSGWSLFPQCALLWSCRYHHALPDQLSLAQQSRDLPERDKSITVEGAFVNFWALPSCLLQLTYIKCIINQHQMTPQDHHLQDAVYLRCYWQQKLTVWPSCALVLLSAALATVWAAAFNGRRMCLILQVTIQNPQPHIMRFFLSSSGVCCVSLPDIPLIPPPGHGSPTEVRLLLFGQITSPFCCERESNGCRSRLQHSTRPALLRKPRSAHLQTFYAKERLNESTFLTGIAQLSLFTPRFTDSQQETNQMWIQTPEMWVILSRAPVIAEFPVG